MVRLIEEDILRRAERRMIRKKCGVKLADRINTKKLTESLGLKDATVEYVRQGSLRWLGHFLRKDDDECVKKHGILSWYGSGGRERPKFSWKGMIKEFRKIYVNFEDANDRVKWRVVPSMEGKSVTT